jgi:Leucine-rich repeat (LRR) protein
MLRNSIKIIIFLVLFENLNAQIHLNQANISALCYCNPPRSREINLSYKNIKTVDPSTFDGLYLQKLYLHFNEITSIDPSTFNGLTFLQLLELSSNKISFIDPATFNGLKSLQFLLLILYKV